MERGGEMSINRKEEVVIFYQKLYFDYATDYVLDFIILFVILFEKVLNEIK